MVDQFEAEKCLHAASTDNLVLFSGKGFIHGNLCWLFSLLGIFGFGLAQ